MSASIFAANGLPLAKEEAAPSLGPTMKSTMAAHFERAKQATLRALSDKPAVKGTHYFLFTQAANWPMNSRFKSMTPTSLTTSISPDPSQVTYKPHSSRPQRSQSAVPAASDHS